MQGRLGPTGAVALVTLPCRAITARARFWPSGGAPLLSGGAASAALAARALRRAAPGLGGRLRVATDAPSGGGAGGSTLAALLGWRLGRAALGHAGPDWAEAARALLAVEGAVDPLMLSEPGRALWASRAARLVATLPPSLGFLAVGGFDGPGLRTDPKDDAFPDVSALAAALVAARRGQDRAAEAAVATQSATLNQARNPKPSWARLSRLARDAGALGLAVAHTGSAIALLFDPSAPDRAAWAAARLALGRVLVWRAL